MDVIRLDFQKRLVRCFINVYCASNRLLLSPCWHLVMVKEIFLSGRSQQVILEGRISSKKEVLSGVPHGTFLRPLLFLAFINDLPDVVKTSEFRLFVNDCLLFHHIRYHQDSSNLQIDLTALEDWERKYQMHFHPEKKYAQ